MQIPNPNPLLGHADPVCKHATKWSQASVGVGRDLNPTPDCASHNIDPIPNASPNPTPHCASHNLDPSPNPNPRPTPGCASYNALTPALPLAQVLTSTLYSLRQAAKDAAANEDHPDGYVALNPCPNPDPFALTPTPLA